MQVLEADGSVEPVIAEAKLALANEALDIIKSALVELPDAQQRQVGGRLWEAIHERDWQRDGFLPLSDLAFRLAPPVGGS